MAKQATQISTLNAEINCTNYRNDDLAQYGRRESIRIHRVTPELGDDPEQIVLDIAKEIEESSGVDDDGKPLVSIGLERKHIQRCHFIGDNDNKVICRFIPFKKRMQILLNKKRINSSKTGRFKNIFVAEDLTPLRSRLLWYVKNHCKTKFTNLHTRNGVCRAKREGKDSARDPWLTFKNPDELFKHLDDDDEFDLKLFNKSLHAFKVLPDIPDFDFDLDAELPEDDDDDDNDDDDIEDDEEELDDDV